MKTAPAFQFYPSDFLSSTKVSQMNPEETGSYIRLLCHDWLGDGLAIGKTALARLGQVGEISDLVMSCFEKHPHKRGFVTNPRLQLEREKQQAFRNERSTAGKRGAEKRWLSNGSAILENGSAMQEPMAKNGSSSFKLQASSSLKRVPPLPPKEKKPILEGQATPEQIMSLWNNLTAEPIKKCGRLTDPRRLALRARIKEHPELAEWETGIRSIAASDLCNGRLPPKEPGNAAWVCDFDWLAGRKYDALQRALEGKYDNRKRHRSENTFGGQFAAPSPGESAAEVIANCERVRAELEKD